MHILGILIGALAFVGIWWWRFKAAREVAGEIGDAAGRMRGAYRRSRFRAKANKASLTAIDDPRTAAAVVLVAAIEAGRPLTDEDEQAIARWLKDVADDPDAEETVIFARWASRHSYDFRGVMRALTPLLRQTLGPKERDDLIEATSMMINRRGSSNLEQRGALVQLRDALEPKNVRQRPL
ncbi:hypothetical protein [Fulvimarina sp. MAC8]|uniref:hypothetical protein n=1 Tax=Fulvimarina sp. MAC8 TaxID=3162874 RepID=UPI0032EF3067